MRSSRVFGLFFLAMLGACAAGTPAAPDGAAAGDDEPPPIDGAPGVFQLTLTTVGPGTVAVAPAGTDCGTGCSSYGQETEVTITATPDGTATVAGWTGPCAGIGTGTSCTFSLAGEVAVEVTFTGGTFVPASFAYTGAAQSYTVPSGATSLHVVADGASGGDAGSYIGGRGAHVDSVVPVTGGDQLTIIVGGQPPPNVAGLDGCGASGGGGTFVVRGSTALVVGGGGGGAAAYSSYSINGGPASLTENGGSSSTQLGGTGGNGGAAMSYEGGGGGGMIGAGANASEALGGQSFTAGGAGGARASSESCGTNAGGFGGGGGGGNDMGGGGGGYSGGAAQINTVGFPSGGGGSYGLGTPTITLRADAGHGAVTVTPQ